MSRDKTVTAIAERSNNDSSSAALELISVNKKFGENEVLKSIDLRVEPGTTVCIIGPSGSGKSTVLRCINRLRGT